MVVFKKSGNKFIIPKELQILLFLFICNVVFAQNDLTFDFNDQQIKENDNKIVVNAVGISLTEDRFGNSKSAIYLHGHPDSYLNIGTSDLLKPQIGTISVWVNLDRKIYAGSGSISNPIIETKNGSQEDFNCAYGIFYDFNTNRFGAVLTKDSTLDLNLKSVYEIEFNKWYHLAITFDNNLFSFYVNGELQQSAPKRFNVKYLIGDSVVIGNSASIKNNRWSQGVFDDIQIYKKALSSNEINELYNSPNPNKTFNIIYNVIKYGLIALLFIVVIAFFVYRNKSNLKKQKDQFELINKITELELKVVKAQMNPHFISNCLAAIQELILKNDIDNAVLYIAKFSLFLRQILNYSDKNNITILEEVELIKLNIELEQLRFKNNFDFKLCINDNIDINDVQMHALITQPFIENAIWHGLLPLNNIRKPQLKINIFEKDKFSIIEIEDNGVGRKLDKTISESSKGIKLVLDKIKSLNKLYKTSNYKIEIIDLIDEAQEPIGTKIIIQLDDL